MILPTVRAALAAQLLLATPLRAATPPLPAWSRSFGLNLSQSLINPLERGASETALRREVAAILYDVRMGGGQLVRWIVTDVWPQWRCGLDPEQPDGTLDPAWYTVSRVLLEEAARQHVAVVIALSYLSNGAFAATSSDPARNREAAAKAAAHRLETPGGYAETVCPGTPGYDGQASQAALFGDPAVRGRLAARMSRMAGFLAGFPALAALELFNEPLLPLTRTAPYWSTVLQLRAAIAAASPGAARIPVFSGAASWGRAEASAARRAGALDSEAAITVHQYLDFDTDASARLDALVPYLQQLVPGRPVIIAELGSSVPVTTQSDFARMLGTVMALRIRTGIGVWVWGNGFSQPIETQFGLDFNHRSAIGSAYRQYFFADREAQYATAQPIAGHDGAGLPHTAPVAIARLSAAETDPWLRETWTISLAGQRHIGVSRAGVFSRPYAGPPGLFAEPPPTLFLSARDTPRGWLEVARDGSGGWTLRAYRCAADNEAADVAPGAAAEATPDILLGLAAELQRQDLAACTRSRLVFTAPL